MRHIHAGNRSKARERIDCVLIFAFRADELIDSICVRPVCFDSDRIESFFRDQALGNLRAQAVELVSAVRGFSDQNESSIADSLKQGIEVRRFSPEPMSGLTNCF